jgi:osmotically-inducible protein OsmY
MTADTALQADVLDELEWAAGINAARIGVAVKGGVVTLSGEVDSYAEKLDAERAALRVAGVKAVADELTIRLPSASMRSDADLARAVTEALDWNSSIPRDRIKAVVKQAAVTLEGEVDWAHQRTAATEAVRRLTGVLGVTDHIVVKPRVTQAGIQTKIEQAFKRSAEIDAQRIIVEVVGSTVVLRGSVRSRAEKQEAERVAWASPGVANVKNDLTIAP